MRRNGEPRIRAGVVGAGHMGQYHILALMEQWDIELVGIVDTFGKVLFPQAAGVLVYLLMAAILLWKPEGLFKQG